MMRSVLIAWAAGSVAALQLPAQLKALQAAAGDDVRGVTDGELAASSGRVALAPESAYWIGAGFRAWLGSDEPIAVGRDPRLSSESLSEAFCRGAAARDAGAATTPAMLEALLGESASFCGSVMVTASHLPPEYNGLKLFSAGLGRGLNKKEVKAVVGLAAELCEETGAAAARSGAAAAVEEAPLEGFMDPYVAKLRRTIVDAAGGGDAAPLRGMRVCVNAGNGAGGFFADGVLAPLGADVSSSLHLERDGTFPNHPANPEDKAHVAATSEAVEAAGADVGVMLDADVDRCGLIDGTRGGGDNAVNTNRLVALCAAVALEEHGAGVIVTDPVTSGGMPDFIASRGGTHDRYKMGYRNVIDRAAETLPDPALLAIETSGHSAWRDNNFVDDGCYTAAKLLGRLARFRGDTGRAKAGLLDLLGDGLNEPKESIKVRMAVASLDAVPEAEAALCAAITRAADEVPSWTLEAVNHDGLRCAGGDGDWIIARASLHEPLVSVQLESDVDDGAAAICATLLDFMADCEAAGVDVAPLRKAAGRADEEP